MFILDTMTEMLRRCQEEYSFAEENDSSLHVKMWDFEFFFCVCVRDGCGIFKAFLKIHYCAHAFFAIIKTLRSSSFNYGMVMLNWRKGPGLGPRCGTLVYPCKQVCVFT